MHHRAWASASRAISTLLPFVALACTSDPTATLTAPGGRPSVAAAAVTVPSPPQNVSATPGNARARVTWQAPANTNGLPVGIYVVRATPGSAAVSVLGTVTKATVGGLRNGTSYTFTVTALVGPDGSRVQSAPSAPSNAVIPGTTTTNAPPTASITGPPNGASFAPGTPVTFIGSGTDPEDGALTGASLAWTSSVDGPIGTGPSFTTTSLSVGAHTITLTALDSQGATGTATLSITITPSVPPPPPSSSARWVTGYYVGYQRDLYPETSVDFSNITHIIVGAAQPNMNGTLDTRFYVDPVDGPIMAKALTTRAHAAGRKAIMMLGGDGWHDQLASASSNANRARFVSSILQAMNTLGFDGVDIDWEPIDPPDQPRVLQLLKDLRAARPNIIVTFPVFWVNTNFGADPWLAQVAPLVDQFNIMSYLMADNWGGWVSWHTSALFGNAPNRPSSVSSSVAAYRAIGVPAAKIGIGVGAFGACWQGVNTMLAQIDNTPAGVGASDNDMSYTNIVSLYYLASAYRWDATAQMGYLSFPSPVGPDRCSMVSYDDPASLAVKGAWVKSQGLGGAMMWTVNQQHFLNVPTWQSDPLLRALYAAIQ